MCTTSAPTAGEPFGVGDGPGVAGGEAVQDAADDRCRGARGRTAPVLRAAARMRSGMLSGGDEVGVVGVDDGPAGGQRRGGVEQFPEFGPVALSGPGALAFAEQPEAADVAQVADGAVHAAFVGEVRVPAGLGQDRMVEFDAHQGPGAGGDVGEVSLAGAGTAATAEAVSCEPTATTLVAAGSPVRSAMAGQQGSERFARLDQRRKQVLGQAEGVRGTRVAHSPATASNSPVVEALVASVRRWPVSRNAIRSGISSACSPSRSGLGGELVERVELQELQPGGGVEPCRVQFSVHAGDGGAAAFVAVAVRLRERVSPAALTRP